MAQSWLLFTRAGSYSGLTEILFDETGRHARQSRSAGRPCERNRDQRRPDAARRALHAEGACRGTLLIASGRSEYIEKYFETIGELLARGLCVVAFDWRGQGLSTRELGDRAKGHIDDFSLYFRDLDAVRAQVLEPHCPKPWYALGHSMGGAVLLDQAHAAREDGAAPFARIVLSAPMIDFAGLRFPKLARSMASVLDSIGLGGAFVPGGGRKTVFDRGFANNPLTSDERRSAASGISLRRARTRAWRPDGRVGSCGVPADATVRATPNIRAASVRPCWCSPRNATASSTSTRPSVSRRALKSGA